MSELKAPPLSPLETTQLSKLLSYVLRHGAVKEKLTITSDGYIAVQDLVRTKKICVRFFLLIQDLSFS
jgi:RNA:NAD 2'-phosphotransferase (TPT1/KptA family)